MKLNIIAFLFLFSVLCSSVLADQVKLEIPTVGPFNVGDTFHLLVYYNPEGGAIEAANEKIISEIAFTVVNPDPASITFQSASSSGPLRTIRSNQKSGDNWAYRESGNDQNYFCEGNIGDGGSCVGRLNDFNLILDITARVDAVPEGGLTFMVQDLEGLNIDVQNVNPTAVYVPDPAAITFAAGDVCDANHRNLCITQDTCLAVEGSVWYEDGDGNAANNCLASCPAGTEDPNDDKVCTIIVADVCDANHRNLCITQETCEAVAGSVWYENVGMQDLEGNYPDAFFECRAGAPQECVPGVSQCIGQTSRKVCQDDRTWPADAEMCNAGLVCQNGQCQASEAVCGNSITEAGETCDDGNVVANDGCSAVCQTEQQALAGDLNQNNCYDSADIYGAGNSPTNGFITFIQGLLGNNNNIQSLNTFIWNMFNQWGVGCN